MLAQPVVVPPFSTKFFGDDPSLQVQDDNYTTAYCESPQHCRESRRQAFYWEDDAGAQDLIVLPSLTFDVSAYIQSPELIYSEERMLYHLFLLRRPNTRIVYFTSMPVVPATLKHYFALLPSHVTDYSERLLLLSPNDPSPRPLVDKLLERPDLLARAREFVRSDKTRLVVYRNSASEHGVAAALGLSLPTVASADVEALGTKAGCRALFAQAGVPLPAGTKLCFDIEDELPRHLVALVRTQPHRVRRLVVKQNDGAGGSGNALLDVPAEFYDGQHSDEQLVDIVRRALPTMKLGSPEPWEAYRANIERVGALGEVWVDGVVASPSAQAIVAADGTPHLLSTHEQVLDGVVFCGCTYPANAAYRRQLEELTMRLAGMLAERGVRDSFSVDFVAVPTQQQREQHEQQAQSANSLATSSSERVGIRSRSASSGSESELASQDSVNSFAHNEHAWQLYAIEINLRLGGTTCPQMALRTLCNVFRCAHERCLRSRRTNKLKFYYATDYLHHPALKQLSADDLLRIVERHALLFDSHNETGIVLHMLGRVRDYATVGVVCIADSSAEASNMYDRLCAILTEELAHRSS